MGEDKTDIEIIKGRLESIEGKLDKLSVSHWHHWILTLAFGLMSSGVTLLVTDKSRKLGDLFGIASITLIMFWFVMSIVERRYLRRVLSILVLIIGVILVILVGLD